VGIHSRKTARKFCLPTAIFRGGFCLQGSFPHPLLGEPKPLSKPQKTFAKLFAKNLFAFGKSLLPRRGGGERDKPLSSFAGKGVSRMSLQAYHERIQHQFDAYCKKVLRNAARDIYRQLSRQSEREISLSELPTGGANIAAVMDEYFQEEQEFEALGFNIAIKSELLAEALRLLPERQRDIIIGYYFLGMSDRAIGEESDTRRSTVSYQRNSALQKLKQILEGLQHEK